MISPDGLRLQATLRFTFLASNNEAEYEALIAGLKLAKVVGANRVEANRQAEAVNKILKVTLKKKLLAYKNNWPEELPRVLWAYKTTARTTTRNSPFSMAYGCEAMVSVEAIISSHRRTTYDPTTNQALLQEALDLVDELREES
uniref:Reverse transcriptase domain-containing protein n=1 Tax=Cannabis sativa TaxID=3483 RepID=A0A803PS77_CANSA